MFESELCQILIYKCKAYDTHLNPDLQICIPFVRFSFSFKSVEQQLSVKPSHQETTESKSQRRMKRLEKEPELV